MIDHFGIGCADMTASAHFYDEVLGLLGFTRQLDHGVAIGYGTEGHPVFWISQAPEDGPNREAHVAFTAADSDVVRAFHDRAVELGAMSLHEPRLWPEYHERYFGAFVRDPDGNNVEAVTHAGESSGDSTPAPTRQTSWGGDPTPEDESMRAHASWETRAIDEDALVDDSRSTGGDRSDDGPEAARPAETT